MKIVILLLQKGHLQYVIFIPSMLKKHWNVMSYMLCHIHQSLHIDCDSWWINLAEVMFCDKRQSLSWSLLLHSCKWPASKSPLAGELETQWCFLSRTITWLRLVLRENYVCIMPVWDHCVAQKHPLCLGPYLFIKKKSKGPRGEWNEDCTSLKQIPGMLGRERFCSTVVHMSCFMAAFYDLQASPGVQCME